jgi:hypothetical protein
MPEEKEKMVPIDTSGPDATVDIEEVKEEVGMRKADNMPAKNKKKLQVYKIFCRKRHRLVSFLLQIL